MRHLTLVLTLLSLAGCPSSCQDPTGEKDPVTTDSADTSAPDSPTDSDLDSGDTGPEACEPYFPPLDLDETGDSEDSGEPLPELDRTGLIAEWHLDGDWSEAVGGLDLVAFRDGGFSAADVARDGANQAYGPTGYETDNGAASVAIPALDLALGLSMDAWYYKPDNNTKGILFGLGESRWGTPRLYVQDAWGALQVVAGEDGSSVAYDRQVNGCWHHLAVVFPPDLDRDGGEVALYVDGALQSPTSGDSTLPSGREILGGTFRAGTFELPYGAAMRLDELRLWNRPLSAEEVSVAALPRGGGEVCPSVHETWEPGPRCVFPDGYNPSDPAMEVEVRVIDDRTLAVLADPMPWLYTEMETVCGAYLSAMEENLATLDAWWWEDQYHYALSDVLIHDWPLLVSALSVPEAWRVAGCEHGEEATVPAETIHWLSPTREARIPRQAPGEGTLHDGHAERLLVGYLRLPWPLREGATYAVQDRWGNGTSLEFSSQETISWAIKLNQVGGPLDHPARRAILGAWLGPAGGHDLSRFEGAPFSVVDEATGEHALEGRIGKARESEETGEILLDLDLSALDAPGIYHVVVPNMGRSWSFTLGSEALGEAFYVHARGLYHNRCAPLDPALTPWARGDIHTVLQAGFPPDDDDYDDHSAEGWGLLDASGAWVSLHHFTVVEATATDIPVRVSGGWHDAADYDRRPQHLGIVQDLLVSYELAPENFPDGQLHIPESGNGLPDILDEAIWGMSLWRSAQQADGGVGTWIEATSHPTEYDPGRDTQPYFLSYATRNSSLDYARHAAFIARILDGIDHPDAEDWLDSAERSWAYALDPEPHDPVHFSVEGEPLRFVDQPTPGDERVLLAAIELLLATDDPAYTTIIEGLDSAFERFVGDLWWKQDFMEAADIVRFSSRLPPGWGETVLDSLMEQAEVWLAAQTGNAYPWAWYDATHRYHLLWGWGQGRYRPLQDLVLAWKLGGDEAYRVAALAGLDVQLGLNPQGRVDTSGLGHHRTVTALHLPSDADAIDEVSPGISLYGALPSVAWQASERVWAYSEDSRSDPDFNGASLSLLPPPYDPGMSPEEADIALEALLPALRREVLLEASRPEEMEFTVTETISPAAMVTGVLMEPGWLPGAELLDRAPLGAADFRQNLWAMP